MQGRQTPLLRNSGWVCVCWGGGACGVGDGDGGRLQGGDSLHRHTVKSQHYLTVTHKSLYMKNWNDLAEVIGNISSSALSSPHCLMAMQTKKSPLTYHFICPLILHKQNFSLGHMYRHLQPENLLFLSPPPPSFLHLPASFTTCRFRLIWAIVHGPSPAPLKYPPPDLLMMPGIINANHLPSAHSAGMSDEPHSYLSAERLKEADSGGTVSGLLWTLWLSSGKSTPVGVRQMLAWVGKHWWTFFILVVRFFCFRGMRDIVKEDNWQTERECSH